MQEAYNAALKDLAEKKLDQGIAKLIELRKQGQTSSGLEGSLGRALVEKGDFGQGIPLLINSIALDRWSTTSRHNLALAQERVVSGTGLPLRHPAEWASQFSSYLRAEESFFLGLIFIVAFLYARHLKKGRRLHRALAIAGLLLMVVASFERLSLSIATITEESDLRSAAVASAEVNQKLPPGARVRVIQSSGDFSEVERPGSFRGWVDSKSLMMNAY
jgi:hypothetical protein